MGVYLIVNEVRWGQWGDTESEVWLAADGQKNSAPIVISARVRSVSCCEKGRRLLLRGSWLLELGRIFGGIKVSSSGAKL